MFLFKLWLGLSHCLLIRLSLASFRWDARSDYFENFHQMTRKAEEGKALTSAATTARRLGDSDK